MITAAAQVLKNMPKQKNTNKFTTADFIRAASLAWFIPGGGHFYLGLRKRAVLLFVCIEVTFFIGLYIGTVRIVHPAHSFLWFFAQVFTGLNTIVSHLWAVRLDKIQATVLIRNWSYYMGVLYTGVAGLMNLLAILDTVIRAGRANSGQVPLPAD